MKLAKTLFMILVTVLLCCSYSIGQPSNGTGIGENLSTGAPVVLSKVPLGLISNGVSIYPVGPISDKAIAYLGEVRNGASIFPVDQVNSGAIAYVGGVRNGAIVSL